MSAYTTEAESRTGSEQTDDTRQRVPVAGGVLVYEQLADQLGRRLIGFEDVADWDDLRSALAARGHSVGAVHHKPVLDGSAETGSV